MFGLGAEPQRTNLLPLLLLLVGGLTSAEREIDMDEEHVVCKLFHFVVNLVTPPDPP